MALIEQEWKRERGCGQERCDGGHDPDASWLDAFESAWPAVERRLRQVLRARKVPAVDREDLLQEVAARAIAAQVAFHCSADLLPWASTVLRRVHGRHLHKLEQQQLAMRRTGVRCVPDAASAAIAHLDLARVAETMASWSPLDRETLLGAADPATAPGASDSGAVYVRRHRLRAKLLSAIDGLGVVLGRFRRFHLTHGREAHDVAAACLSPVAIACAALMLPFVGSGSVPTLPAGPSVPVDVAWAPSGSTDAGTAAAPTPPVAQGSHGTAAAAASDRRGRGDEGRHGSRPLDSPVEHEVEADAGGHHATVGVENNEDRRPLWCSSGRILPDTCVDQPGGPIVIPLP